MLAKGMSCQRHPQLEESTNVSTYFVMLTAPPPVLPFTPLFPLASSSPRVQHRKARRIAMRLLKLTDVLAVLRVVVVRVGDTAVSDGMLGQKTRSVHSFILMIMIRFVDDW